jgi:geranylgeranyl diphosphate synthase type II
MITLKTSVLLGACLQMAAIIAKRSESEQKAIYEFGKNIGIAFQIQDDVLDTYGDAHAVGKRKGGDIAQNKKTYLYLKALELCSDHQKSRLVSLYKEKDQSNEESKIAEVTKLFDTLVVREYANQVMDAYKDLSISHLLQSGLPVSGIDELGAYADFLISRSH